MSGVFVGRGVLRNPWILAQARDLLDGRPPATVSRAERGEFLLDYMRLLLNEGDARSGRLPPPGARPGDRPAAAAMRSRERWVINKLRALCTWYTKGLEGGSHLRIAVNAASSIGEVEALIGQFFMA